jgi:hypothetical protein
MRKSALSKDCPLSKVSHLSMGREGYFKLVHGEEVGAESGLSSSWPLRSERYSGAV